MQIHKNCVLLLKAEKSEDSNDKFENILRQNKFDVKHLKTLDFKYNNLHELGRKLKEPDNYSGIIFTTPRTVRAVKEATASSLGILASWANKANYVVGETTNNLMLNELELNCSGQDAGNAKNLAEFILRDKDNISKSLLFPCGTLKTDTLINRLNEEQIIVESVIVYETVPNKHLSTDFCRVTLNFSEIPEYWVYFSPSGVNNTEEYLQKISEISHLIKFVAIGPTTENCLKERHISVHSVALKPTPEALLNAILK